MADDRPGAPKDPGGGAGDAPHHPLPDDEKARRDEIPENIEREKERSRGPA